MGHWESRSGARILAGVLHRRIKSRAKARKNPWELSKQSWATGRVWTSKMLFSSQVPHRGAPQARPEWPSCSLRVTTGPGVTAEPHRAARAQHTLDSAIFTAREAGTTRGCLRVKVRHHRTHALFLNANW
jgi:hypothetical protein